MKALLEKIKNRAGLLVFTSLITAWLSQLFLLQISLGESFLLVLICAVMAVAIVELITYNWKSFLIFVGIVVGHVVSSIAYVPVLSDVVSLFNSVFTQLYRKIFWMDKSLYISETLTTLLLCIVVGLTIHVVYTRIKNIHLSILMFLVYLLSLELFFQDRVAELYVGAFLAMFALLYLWFYKNKPESKGKLIWIKYVLPVMAAILLITSILTLTWNMEINSDFSERINNFLETGEFQLPSGQKDFTLEGFEQQNGKIGGDTNIKSRYQFSVKSNSSNPENTDSMYLRGVVCDTFEDLIWKSNINDGKKYTMSEYFRRNQLYSFDGYEKMISGMEYLYQRKNYTITGQASSEKTLFGELLMDNIYTYENVGEIYYEKSGRIYYDSKNMLFEYAGSYYDLIKDDNLRYFTEYESESSYRAYSMFDNSMKEYEGYYLQIPKEIPETVRALAREITINATSDYDKAVEIEKFLKENYTYSLKPGDVPKNKDLVSYFLFENKEGYCTYYATSMIILCRSLNMPSRYVKGYRVDDTENGKVVNVTTENLHAWVEVYLPRLGWVTFDPVSADSFRSNIINNNIGQITPPPQQTTPTPVPDNTPTPAPSNDETSTPETETLEPTEQIQETTEPEQENPQESNLPQILLIVALSITAAGAIFFVIKKFNQKKLANKISEKTPENLYKRFIITMTIKGHNIEKKETVKQFFEKIDNAEFEKLQNFFEKSFYSCKPDPEEDLEYVIQYIEILEKDTIKEFGRIKWLKVNRNYKKGL